MVSEKFSEKVLQWFDQHGRKNLPWQKPISPYRVWVSEIMLQQTQVKTVIPYFEAFVNEFPDVAALASADMDKVLSFWSGLGYYARARNLHLAAKKIILDYHGVFPDSLEGLCALPGVGRSTAGAILAIAYGKKAAILDGNVRRVLCRFHAIEGFWGDVHVQKKLWPLAQCHTPDERVGDYTQAMMDLGAVVCKKSSPNCLHCPLNDECLAYQTKKVQNYPAKKPKKIQAIRACYMLLLTFGDEELFLYRRQEYGVWGGLWSLPEFSDLKAFELFCVQWGINEGQVRFGALYRHTFSHFHLDITPIHIKLPKKPWIVMEGEQGAWHCIFELNRLGLPSIVKKLVEIYVV